MRSWPYAGNPEHPAVLVDRKIGSEKLTGAGNQQERPKRSQERFGILRGHTPAGSVTRVEDMVLAPWRHGDQLERNSLSGKFRPARMV